MACYRQVHPGNDIADDVGGRKSNFQTGYRGYGSHNYRVLAQVGNDKGNDNDCSGDFCKAPRRLGGLL